MPDYITWPEVVARYPAVDRVGGASEVGSVHIEYAQRELEGYLSGFFTVPFSSNNVTAKDLAIDLTYLRVGNFKMKDRVEFRKEVMNRIQMLKDGMMTMMTTSGSLGTVAETVYSDTQDYTPIFGHGNVEDFVVDSSQLYDEENARG